jgi:hypothetical protein
MMPFGRLKKWFSAAQFSRRKRVTTTLEVASPGLLFRELDNYLLIRWEELERVVAVRHEQYIGNTFSLHFETSDQKCFQVSESNSAWPSVRLSLELYLPGVMKEEIWSLLLIASESGVVDIYKK